MDETTKNAIKFRLLYKLHYMSLERQILFYGFDLN